MIGLLLAACEDDVAPLDDYGTTGDESGSSGEETGEPMPDVPSDDGISPDEWEPPGSCSVDTDCPPCPPFALATVCMGDMCGCTWEDASVKLEGDCEWGAVWRDTGCEVQYWPMPAHVGTMFNEYPVATVEGCEGWDGGQLLNQRFCAAPERDGWVGWAGCFRDGTPSPEEFGWSCS